MDASSFALSAEQRRILDGVRAFGERHFTHENIRQWRKDQNLPGNVVKEFLDMDFGLIEFVTGDSHQGQSLFTTSLILEELSRSAGATIPFVADFLDIHVLARLASAEHFERIAEEYRKTGRLGFSFAVSEPQAGSDIANMSTVARTVDDGYVLDGRKTFVNNGEFTPFILVVACDGDREDEGEGAPLSAWLVPYDLEGVRTYPIEKRGQRLLPFSDVLFEGVKLPRWCKLSEGGFSRHDLNSFFRWGRVLTCAGSVGMAQAALDDSVAHAFEREAFGETIASFQQVQLMLVEMEVKVQTMRFMLYQAARSLDEDTEDARLNVALAKHYIPRTAVEVASDAIQVLGARGYTENERAYGIWEDCRGSQIMEGTDQIMVNIAAPLLKKKYLG